MAKTMAKSAAVAPLTEEMLSPLREKLRGALCLPGDPGYEQARTIWNAMIDRHPGAVVRAAGAADVIAAVDFARERRLLLSIRGGGHNIAGNAVCEGGLMIDLSPMKSVRVDPVHRTARVEPGVTLGELDRETQAFGLATPLGINSTTGVAGLALGGGFGWTSRKLGLTADNLLSADVVTADGQLVHASEAENPDLFWAIRGGGGNFGVVTSFEFRLHPLGPVVLAGLVVHPLVNARELLSGYRRFVAGAPDELTCWAVLRKAPPLPFLPPEVHGTEIVVLAAPTAARPPSIRRMEGPGSARARCWHAWGAARRRSLRSAPLVSRSPTSSGPPRSSVGRPRWIRSSPQGPAITGSRTISWSSATQRSR